MTLAASVPIGLFAGRIGSRRSLLASAALLPLSLVVLGLADGLATLIAGRALFGLSFAILWTVAPAVAAGSGRGAAGTGRLIAAAGAGWLVGPVLSGVMTDVWGYRVAFVAIALLTLPLVVRRSPERASEEDRAPAGACGMRSPQRATSMRSAARCSSPRCSEPSQACPACSRRSFSPTTVSRPERSASSSPSPLSSSRRGRMSHPDPIRACRRPARRDDRCRGRGHVPDSDRQLLDVRAGRLPRRVGGRPSSSRLDRLRARPLHIPRANRWRLRSPA